MGLHRRHAYGFALFHLFNKDWQKALQQSYKLTPPTTVSKHHTTSTTHRGLDEALCLSHHHRRLPGNIQIKLLVHDALEVTSTSQSTYPSPECPIKANPLSRLAIDATTVHDARRRHHPAWVHEATCIAETLLHHATETQRCQQGRCKPLCLREHPAGINSKIMPTWRRATPYAAMSDPGAWSTIFLGVARTRRQELIATKELLAGASMQEMMSTPPSTDPRI
jgi:hypothetical protein